MTTATPARPSTIATPPRRAVWLAGLELAYGRSGARTVPTLRRHHGPLRVQRGLLPEGLDTWHQVVVHPPGGIASGDSLEIAVSTGRDARALLTSPGAARWYRARDIDGSLGDADADAWARQSVRLTAAEGSALEWLPLETLVFDGARARWTTDIDVAPGAALLAAELVCLGEPASRRPFARGRLRWHTRIRRGGRLLFEEQAALRGADPLLASPAGLGGHPVFGTLYAVGAAADPALVSALRAIDAPGEAAITAIDELVLVRWRGDRVDDGWTMLRAAWAMLRPALVGRTAIAPRIWAT